MAVLYTDKFALTSMPQYPAANARPPAPHTPAHGVHGLQQMAGARLSYARLHGCFMSSHSGTGGDSLTPTNGNAPPGISARKSRPLTRSVRDPMLCSITAP
ncbi:hypothetical protein P3T76_002835 [Phytophthora citrophthora]|uniref:Uncharacterized protein n=1 Tax=Phytophthora citrophthora TaxID=4793 RepID=A0AAD9LSR2_9STRA|nr:hypothetical protein P3T76_002835 [Phytophthora citrophthora]